MGKMWFRMILYVLWRNTMVSALHLLEGFRVVLKPKTLHKKRIRNDSFEMNQLQPKHICFNSEEDGGSELRHYIDVDVTTLLE